MPYQVHYWEYNPGTKPRHVKTDVCFARFGLPSGYGTRKIPDYARYICEINGGLTDEQVIFWIDLLGKWLDKRVYTARRIKWQKRERMLWLLRTKGMTYAKALVYLTAFRYTDEFPALITELWPHRAEDEAALFVRMMTIHLAHRWDGGHTFVMTYAYKPDSMTPTLADFRARLADEKTPTVNAHFAPMNPPAPCATKPIMVAPIAFAIAPQPVAPQLLIPAVAQAPAPILKKPRDVHEKAAAFTVGKPTQKTLRFPLTTVAEPALILPK